MKRLLGRKLSRSSTPLSSLKRCRLVKASGIANPRSFGSVACSRAVIPYLLADIGEGITECQVTSWSVKEGDRVAQFDPICEVQSDKASVEITSRFDGVIKKLHYGLDDLAIVGKPLLDIDVDDEVTEGEQLLEGAAGDSNIHHPKDDGDAEISITKSPSSPSPIKSVPDAGGMASPSVRHILKQLDIDISAVQGTGKDGRVLEHDVQRLSREGTVSEFSGLDQPQDLPPAIEVQDQTVFLTPFQTSMFKTMTRSLSIPHFLYSHTIDCTALNGVRQKANANAAVAADSEERIPKLTALPFVLKALSQAFLRFPSMNAHLDVDTDPKRPRLLLKAKHHFGVAVDSPSGLLVPVVRNVQDQSVASLASEIQRLAELAKENRLSSADLQGATFLVSNIGAIGGGVVQPIIVPPMVGIVGIGRAQEAFKLQKDSHGVNQVVSRQEIVLSWSSDHRVLDGATVARCAESVTHFLENVDGWSVSLK